MKKQIYVDNAATTPVSERALAAMLPHFSQDFGNPSAIYSLGLEAKKALEDARRRVAKALGARVNEVYFTSGGTESDNWALHGAVEQYGSRGRHIVTTAVEHSAVVHTAEKLASQGYELTVLPVDRHGQVEPGQVAEAVRDDTVLVSIMLANNEIGTVLPIKELCRAAKERNRRVLFHTDAVQAVGHIPVNVRDLGVDLLSLSAHKFNGPKGAGALFVKLGNAFPAYITGGGQEKDKRSGTSNVPGAVGMATALEEATAGLGSSVPKIAGMRNRLVEGVLRIPGAHLTGDPENRLPGTASFVFDGLARRPLVKCLDEHGICASSGSSCSAGSGDPSRVLIACGYPEDLATASLRITLSEANTDEEVDFIVDKLSLIVGMMHAGHYRPALSLRDAWDS